MPPADWRPAPTAVEKREKAEQEMTLFALALNPGGIISWIVIGLIAGWLAGVAMKGGGYGIIGDIIVGLIGALTNAGERSTMAEHRGGGRVSQDVSTVDGCFNLRPAQRAAYDVGDGRTG